jgi:uncharacterized protein (TIRG00374 family)
VITLAIFAYVLRGIDLAAAAAALRRFSVTGIEEALALIALDRAIMYWRWSILVRTIAPAPPTNLVRIFLVSSFVGSFLPGGVGGDAARAYQVGRQTRNVGGAIASVVMDRWLGLMAVGLAGCVGVLASIAAVPAELRELTIALTIAFAVAGAATLHADRIIQKWFPEAFRRTAWGTRVEGLTGAFATYRQAPAALMTVMFLSLAVQTTRILLAWVIGDGLGIALPFRYYWVFMPLNILLILLPLSLGGFGLPQGAMVWTLGPLGVGQTEAFLLSLLFVLAGIVGNLPGAVLYAIGQAPRVEGVR